VVELLYAIYIIADNLPLALQDIFVGAKAIKPDRASGMDFICGNTHFCAKTVAKAV
jgi:hypothetical protein